MIGSRLGNYEVIAQLGEGGMGVVYCAKDLQLGRLVALKVLPAAFAEDPERIAWLEREARLLASLNHPNIAQIYGFHQNNAVRALVMELVEGPTLAEFLAGRLLPLEDSLSIAIQIVQALTAAHDQGIVHRDLKPQNIKLAPGGRVKVLDFGLAYRQPGTSSLFEDLTLSSVPKADIILGTVGYMAPEQVRGESVDTRADIFSFGCVLYEIVTGKRAFARSSPIEGLAAILHDKPEAPSRLRQQLPASLDRLIAHCLEKERSARFQSARDLEFVLSAFAPAETVQAVRPRAASVAVLPFANLSADLENEFFADGITEDVIAHLARIRSLKVISRTSIMAFKKSERSLREIGEKLGAATVVEGSIRRAGNRVRIVAQLVDAHSDEHIWSDIYDRDLTDIFTIQSDVALKIATALRAQLSNEERVRVDRRPTEDFEAYELYLRARNHFYLFSAEGLRRSLVNYEGAIARDPGFALAWAGIARSYTELCIGGGSVGSSPEDAISNARAAAARALELDDQLAEAHSISGFVRFIFDFDWVGAESEFLTAIELCPGSAEAHEHYSWLCTSLERYDDALREVRRARELDPLLIKSDLGTTLLRAGRIDEALEEARRAVRNDPEIPRVHSNLGWALILHGEHAAGIASMEQAAALSPGSTLFLSQLGQAHGYTGNVEGARKILQHLQDRAAHEFVSPYHFAYVYAGLGEADTAVDWLERAFERRSGAIYGIKGSFLFRNLRSHPRFKALLQRMNLS